MLCVYYHNFFLKSCNGLECTGALWKHGIVAGQLRLPWVRSCEPHQYFQMAHFFKFKFYFLLAVQCRTSESCTC
jgi:hypothetical protein